MQGIASQHLIREVWAGNLQREFINFNHTLRLAGPGAVVAIDTEFPGVLQENAWKESDETYYLAMKESVELLPVIQIGLAIGSAYGKCLGAWNFNMKYDLEKDLHTDAAIRFLKAVGVDFERHKVEGLEGKLLGALLKGSDLSFCSWVTVSGMTDLAYLVQLMDADLPDTLGDFEALLETACAGRYEVRDWLPLGSLESLAKTHGVIRRGRAHTAASDAKVTLELYFKCSDSEGDTVASTDDADSNASMSMVTSQRGDQLNSSAPRFRSSTWGRGHLVQGHLKGHLWGRARLAAEAEAMSRSLRCG